MRAIRSAAPPAAGFSTLVVALAVAGCELQNPNAITEDTVDALLLIQGAKDAHYEPHSFLNGAFFIVSDEGVVLSPHPLPQYLAADQNSDFGLLPAFLQEVPYQQLHQGRVLCETAIRTAVDEGDFVTANAALQFLGHIFEDLAYYYGDQPLAAGEDPLTQAEIYREALELFEEVAFAAAEDVDPEVRLAAHAGIARVSWFLGRESGDTDRLEAVVDATGEVLTADPAFWWGITYGGPFANVLQVSDAPLFVQFGLWTKGPDFATVLFAFERDVDDPQAHRLYNFRELELIRADAQALLGDLAEAKATVKATEVLADNHVGLVRDRGRDEPPLSQAEIDGLIDPLDAPGLQAVIDELLREALYGVARRDRAADGSTPLLPLPFPPNAF